MKRLSVLAVLLTALTGGCAGSGQTELLLRVAETSLPPVQISFQDVCWTQIDRDLVIAGDGYQPNAHERKWGWLWSGSGYISIQPRWLVIRGPIGQAGAPWEVELTLDNSLLHWPGQPAGQYVRLKGFITPPQNLHFERIGFEFDFVPLSVVGQEQQKVVVSGRVVALRLGRSDFERKLAAQGRALAAPAAHGRSGNTNYTN